MTMQIDKKEAVWGGPGMFARVPEEQYFALDAASKSRLAIIAQKSPKHLKYILDHGQDETEAMKIGKAVHCAIFEPERFSEEYTVAGMCESTIKSGPRKDQPCGKPGIDRVDDKWACGTHGGIEAPEVLKADDHAEIMGMVEAIKGDDLACRLVRCPGWTEVSMVWTDTNTGELCKCRIDRLVRCKDFIVKPGDAPWSGYAVIDPKTTLNAGDHGFRKFISECYSRFYHVQAAMNLDAVIRHLNVHAKQVRFFNLAIEKSAPYAVRAYEIMPSLLTLGWDEFQNLLAVYAKCKKTGEWPGYSPSLVNVEKETWMKLATKEQSNDDDATESNA